jgi:hypothetical protein
MSDRRTQVELPLLLAGIPEPVEEMLRRTGVPIARRPAGTGGQPVVAGRIVLFDSRVSPVRLDAKSAKTCGLTTIDVSRLGLREGDSFVGKGHAAGRVQPGDGRADELAFLIRLKGEIEGAGGIWLRVAEFPFPFQHVLCDPDGHQRNVSGLFWQTNCEELNRWQQVRRNLVVRVQRRGAEYDIDYDGQLQGFRPALELWRGSHVATLPLFPGGMSVCENGLVFQRDGRRHPAGCWTKWINDLVPQNSKEHARRRSA